MQSFLDFAWLLDHDEALTDLLLLGVPRRAKSHTKLVQAKSVIWPTRSNKLTKRPVESFGSLGKSIVKSVDQRAAGGVARADNGKLRRNGVVRNAYNR